MLCFSPNDRHSVSSITNTIKKTQLYGKIMLDYQNAISQLT
jgi:hypothetical protein